MHAAVGCVVIPTASVAVADVMFYFCTVVTAAAETVVAVLAAGCFNADVVLSSSFSQILL